MKKKRRSPIKHPVKKHDRKNGATVRAHTRGSGAGRARRHVSVKRILPKIIIADVEVNIKSEYNDYGTFSVSGLTKDGREFVVKGNWDTGGHPEGYSSTKFLTKAKFSREEKRLIKTHIANRLAMPAESSPMSNAFQNAFEYAMECDYPPYVGSSEVDSSLAKELRDKEFKDRFAKMPKYNIHKVTDDYWIISDRLGRQMETVEGDYQAAEAALKRWLKK